MDIKSLQMNSPFYAAYMQQKNIIDSAIEKAIYESAEKIGRDMVNELFSIKSNLISQKRAA